MCNSFYDKIFEDVYDPKVNNRDEVICLLKEAGASQVDCLQTISKKLNLSLNEADEIVLHSEAWKDAKEQTLLLREDFWEGLKNFDEATSYE